MSHETITKYVKKNFLQLTVQVVGIITVLANLWIVAQLAPLKQDIALGFQRIGAMEEQVKELKKIQEDRISKADVETMLNYFDKELKNMSGKIDTLYQLHMK